jgi:hypothetical protein
MRGWVRSLLLVEIFVCFLPCTLLLLIGATMLPMQVIWLFEEPLNWEGVAMMLFSVAGGIVGLVALVFVISRLLWSGERFERPVPVLGGILAGIASLLLPFLPAIGSEGEPDWAPLTFTTLLPLVATAHILFLSRNLFIAGFRAAPQPLIGRGMWITGAVVVSVVAVVIVLRQGVGSAALEERMAYWLQNKPAAYSYTSQVAGWIKPVGVGYPKQVRVIGSTVTGASYTFGRGPGDTTQYPAPTEGAWTIDELFQRLLDAKKHGARVHVRFDGSTGAVLHARVDNAAEDAVWDFEVREFRALDEAAAREPAPMFISR